MHDFTWIDMDTKYRVYLVLNLVKFQKSFDYGDKGLLFLWQWYYSLNSVKHDHVNTWCQALDDFRPIKNAAKLVSLFYKNIF